MLASVRAFVKAHGRRPSVQEIADASGLDASVVRRALVYGQIVGR